MDRTRFVESDPLVGWPWTCSAVTGFRVAPVFRPVGRNTGGVGCVGRRHQWCSRPGVDRLLLTSGGRGPIIGRVGRVLRPEVGLGLTAGIDGTPGLCAF